MDADNATNVIPAESIAINIKTKIKNKKIKIKNKISDILLCLVTIANGNHLIPFRTQQ